MTNAATITIDTPLGAVSGTQRDAVAVFRGVRYATAERFAAPVRTGGWTGVLDATAAGPQCPQTIGFVERAIGAADLPMSEDCLRLDIVTPACDGARRAVMVWIHGGGFTSGSGSMPWYDGESLATHGDIVVVTINYRLGALGFAGTSNLGIRDQIAALGWVHDHIAAFGGDPGRVTIVGESAGGSSVVALLATPSAAGLFRAGWAMSPSITQLRSTARADEALGELLDAAGVTDLADLAAAPVEDLLDAQAKVLADYTFTAFSPAVDGDLFDGPIPEAAATNRLPLVLGTTHDEMALFLTFDPRLASVDEAMAHDGFRTALGEAAETAWQAYRAARPTATPKELLVALHTDVEFRAPMQRLAQARLDADGTEPTWVYSFDWATPVFGGLLGACHALDLAFAFDNLDAAGVGQFTGDSPERTLVADAYAGAIARFVATGDPGWPAYDTDRRAVQRFDAPSDVLADPEPELRQLWARR